MLFEKEDYIVKAKDVDIEIKQSILNKYKSVKYFIFTEIFAFILVLILIIFSKDIAVNAIMYIGFFIMATVVIILESNWSIKIKDRIIYIKNHSGNHKIKYKDLVYFRICYRTIRHYREKVLNVKYLKKNRIIDITLPYADEFEEQLEQICKAFITKDDIENGIEIGSDYFYIREDDENNIIEKKNIKLNLIVIMVFLLLILIMSCIILMFELLKMIK